MPSQDEKRSAKLRERAKRHMMRRQYNRAIDVCTEALQLTPDNYKVLRIRGIAFCSLGRCQEGLEDAERVLRMVTYSGDAWYQKGYAHFHLKEYSAAARAFAAGLELNDSDKSLQQAFWDAVSLMSQTKTLGQDSIAMASVSADATLMRFPGAAAAIAADV